MFGVAGEGGDGKAVLGGEGTQGRPGDHGVGDLLVGGVRADGTAFIHGWPFLTGSGLLFLVSGGARQAGPAHRSRKNDSRGPVYRLKEQGASTDGTHGRERLKKRKAGLRLASPPYGLYLCII